MLEKMSHPLARARIIEVPSVDGQRGGATFQFYGPRSAIRVADWQGSGNGKRDDHVDWYANAACDDPWIDSMY